VHEALAAEPKRTRALKGRLLHYTFWNYDKFFEKYIRYSKLSAEQLREQGRRAGAWGLLVRPFLRFFQLYIIKGGFLDGLVGIQVCMFMAFFYSFAKQARLWEMQHAQQQPSLPATVPMKFVAVTQEPILPAVELPRKAA
jgi:hypothetical protein